MNHKIGGIAYLSIHRAGGDVEVLPPIHNVISDSLLTSSLRAGGSGTTTFRTYSAPVKVLLDGTYSQAGTTISRASGAGSLLLPAANFVFPYILLYNNGARAYVTSASSATAAVASAGTAALGQTVTAQAAWAINHARNSATSQVVSTSGTNSATFAYSNGVISCGMSAPVSHIPAVAGYTMHGIGISRNAPNAASVYFVDMPSPVTVAIGDVVVLNDFVVRFTWDAYVPRALSVCPIGGITTSCRLQRLFSASSPPQNSVTQVRFVTTANKITLANMSNTSATWTGITALATLTALGSLTGSANNTTNASANNGYAFAHNFFVTTTVALNDIKQIIWGDGSNPFWVLEFDTAQNFAANKAVTINVADTIALEL